MNATFSGQVQSVSDPSSIIINVGDNNPFAEALRISYGFHIPLQLSPDQIWLLIL